MKEPNNSRLLCHAVGEHSKPNALQRTVSRVLQKMI